MSLICSPLRSFFGMKCQSARLGDSKGIVDWIRCLASSEARNFVAAPVIDSPVAATRQLAAVAEAASVTSRMLQNSRPCSIVLLTLVRCAERKEHDACRRAAVSGIASRDWIGSILESDSAVLARADEAVHKRLILSRQLDLKASQVIIKLSFRARPDDD